MKSWLKDQKRYDETGEQPSWQSTNPLVPSSYRLDLEYVCFTNAWNLHLLTGYNYVEGKCRLKGDKSKDAWGNHAWCVAPSGQVVDPYFEWKFPGQQLEYKEEELDD